MANLDSLVLQSISDTDLQCSSKEKTDSQLTFASKNRITKVKIHSIKAKEEIQVIMDLFPRMEYLELHMKSNRCDANTVLKYILTNQLMKVPSLRSICFEDEKVDRNILAKLRETVGSESFIGNHHLRCVKNHIFIQWNRRDAFGV